MLRLMVAVLVILSSFTFGYVLRGQVFKQEAPKPIDGYEVTLRVPTTKEALRKQILINHAQASILGDLDRWWSDEPTKKKGGR